MKICLLYTSYRQLEEIDLGIRVSKSHNILRSSAHVMFHCNNGEISREIIYKKVARLPYVTSRLYYQPQNNVGGYPYGQFEAILDMWDDLIAGCYDLVIHLHPDIFIIDEDLLLTTLAEAHTDSGEIPSWLVTKCFGHRHPSFSTDFFAFRPDAKMRSVFASYLHLLKTPLVVPLESLFFIEVLRTGLPYAVIPRFKHAHYYRDIDHLGLWHEHNIQRIIAYQHSPSRRWVTTFLRVALHPYKTIRATATFLARMLVRIPQDSLLKQLTTI